MRSGGGFASRPSRATPSSSITRTGLSKSCDRRRGDLARIRGKADRRLHRQHRAQAGPRRQGARHQQRRCHRSVSRGIADPADRRCFVAASSTPDLEELICANTRTPEVTWGDIRAQINTNTYGISKFAELFGKYGIEHGAGMLGALDGNLRAASCARRLPRCRMGSYGPETDYLDDDGVDLAQPHRISATLEVKGDTLHFILDSDRQARGPINLRPCVSRNFIECLVKMIFIPQLPVNDGLSRPVKVSYPPEGSLLNPRFPAPVNMYVRPSQVTTSVVMRTLAHAVPGRVPAPGSAAGGSISSAGRHPQFRALVFAIRDHERRHRRAPRRRWRQCHGRARRQCHEHADRGDRERISGSSRTVRIGGRFRRARECFAAGSAYGANGGFWRMKRSSICGPTGSSFPRRACSTPSPRGLRAPHCNPERRREARIDLEGGRVRLEEGRCFVL